MLDQQILGESRRQLESSQRLERCRRRRGEHGRSHPGRARSRSGEIESRRRRGRCPAGRRQSGRRTCLGTCTAIRRLIAPYPKHRRIAQREHRRLRPAGHRRSLGLEPQHRSIGRPSHADLRPGPHRRGAHYVDVPESEANYIVSEVDKRAGDTRPVTKASVRVAAFQNDDCPLRSPAARGP